MKTQLEEHGASAKISMTSRPDREGHHVMKLLPPLFGVHQHLPCLLALYVHLLTEILHHRGYCYTVGRAEQIPHQITTFYSTLPSWLPFFMMASPSPMQWSAMMLAEQHSRCNAERSDDPKEFGDTRDNPIGFQTVQFIWASYSAIEPGEVLSVTVSELWGHWELPGPIKITFYFNTSICR